MLNKWHSPRQVMAYAGAAALKEGYGAGRLVPKTGASDRAQYTRWP